MAGIVRAVFENGLFRPLEPVALREHEVVSLTIGPANPAEPSPSEQGAATPTTADRNAAPLEVLLTEKCLLHDGPTLPRDFLRADLYSEHN